MLAALDRLAARTTVATSRSKLLPVRWNSTYKMAVDGYGFCAFFLQKYRSWHAV